MTRIAAVASRSGAASHAARTLADPERDEAGFAWRRAAHHEVVVLAWPVDEEHAAVLAFLADGESWSSSPLRLRLEQPAHLAAALDSLAAAGKVQSFGRGASSRWLTPPVAGIHDDLVTPRSLPID